MCDGMSGQLDNSLVLDLIQSNDPALRRQRQDQVLGGASCEPPPAATRGGIANGVVCERCKVTMAEDWQPEVIRFSSNGIVGRLGAEGRD